MIQSKEKLNNKQSESYLVFIRSSSIFAAIWQWKHPWENFLRLRVYTCVCVCVCVCAYVFVYVCVGIIPTWLGCLIEWKMAVWNDSNLCQVVIHLNGFDETKSSKCCTNFIIVFKLRNDKGGQSVVSDGVIGKVKMIFEWYWLREKERSWRR